MPRAELCGAEGLVEPAASVRPPEGEYGLLRSNFGEGTRFADVPNPDMAIGIEVMRSEIAVEEAQDALNRAWIGCGNVIDTMPAVLGDEYQSGWGDIGINLAMTFM